MTLGSWIFFPASSAVSEFVCANLGRRAWFGHELTHAWRFQTAPLRTLASWAWTIVSGGYGPGLPGYRYDLPVRFAALGLERQAKVVEHAYLLRAGGRGPDSPPGARWADYAGATPFAGLR